MNDLALGSLLTPVDQESPAGPDLEYDPEFLALERAAVAKPERVMGDEIKAAEEPDWDVVAEKARGLLERSRDLRVAVHLATASLRISGLSGWASGLGLIRGLLENFWDSVHPQLDAEDDNDPTARVNAVASISDAQGALGYFVTTPFVQSPRLGRFSLRELRIANGELKVSGPADGQSALPSMTEIEACCLDCDEAELAGAAAAVATILEHAGAIDRIFTEQVGTAGPELKPLLADAGELKKFLDQQIAKRSPQGEEAGEGGEAAGDGAAPGAAGNGRINGPQDVIRRIEELCAYYDRAEPSSPVPLLLRRAQRLVGRNFADLLKDLAPGGMSELQVISGQTEE
jgi:type VI secretion system protein ImpA